MRGTAAAGNLRAKNGSLTGVTSLAGYVTGADGRRYVFVMMSNYSATSPRPVEDRLGVLLARWRMTNR
jgi:D-alanyl-D-alanine carboxypeptidase/D-alanyl-D-alanine-endopeptidase (penicillin-binding protein 4)